MSIIGKHTAALLGVDIMQTKQEKLRHSIYTILRRACVDCAMDEGKSIVFKKYAEELTDIVLECEKEQGVVIRTGYNQIVVDSPCTIVDIPKCESLIEEKK